MLRKALAVFTLLLITFFNAFSQKSASLKGKVIDPSENTPLELATIAVLNAQDSSLISYTVSDKTGAFKLTNMPAQQRLNILVSYASYQSFKTTLILNGNQTKDLGTIALSHKTLAEVKIYGERAPIAVRKDTIEFNTEAFKTRPNAILEELLKKLPGIQINNDGSILANGKEVSKILVDGKRFFGDDPKMASKNLDAEFIDKIQIYDDRETDPDMLLSTSQVNKIINLKFKKKYKKSAFGKIYAGAGTSKTHEAGTLLNVFRDTLQVSLLGLSNNLSKTAFSNDDIYNNGGFKRGGASSLSNGGVALGGNNFSGLENLLTTGFNINTDYGKKLKINLNYFYSHIKDTYQTISRQQQTLGDTLLTANSKSYRNNTKDQHNLSGLVQWNPDNKTQIRYAPSFSYSGNNYSDSLFTNRFTNFISNTSNEANHDSEKNSQTQFQHSFFFYKKLGTKGGSLTINHGLSLNPNTKNQYYNSDLESFVISQPSATIHRYIENINKKTSVDLNAIYRYPFNKKWTGDVGVFGAMNYMVQGILTYDKNPVDGQYELFLPEQSSNLNRRQLSSRVRPEITYKAGKDISLIAGLNLQWENLKDRFIQENSKADRKYFYLLPFFKIQGQHFSFSYDPTVSFPNAYDLQPVTIIYNPLYTFTGNPGLKPVILHAFTGTYYKYVMDKQLSYSANMNISLGDNAIISQKNINSSGLTQVSPLNIGEFTNYSAFYGGYINKRLKAVNGWQLGFTTSLNGNLYRSGFLINHLLGIQNNKTWGGSQQVTVNWNNLIDLSSQYGIRFNYTDYERTSYTNTHFNTQSFNNKLTFYWPKNVVIETNYNYSYNSQLSPGFQRSVNLLNTAISTQFLKDKRGQVKFTVYDLLNDNVSVARYISENNIYDSENRILKRYFLLSLQYKFNTTKL